MMTVKDYTDPASSVPVWCWKVIKRCMQVGCSLWEQGDLYCMHANKYVQDPDIEGFEQHRVEEFPCCIGRCKQVFNGISKYECHYNSLHRNVCGTCHRSLPTPHLLEIHVLESHDTMFPLLARKQHMYQCLLVDCTERFKDASSRRGHMVKQHKFPTNYRYDRHNATTRSRKPKETTGDNAAKMEVSPVGPSDPSGVQVKDAALAMDTEGHDSAAGGRVFSYKVPKSICFGQGVQRGFARGRGRGRGRKSGARHWHSTQEMDTSVDIEHIDMGDLAQALN